MKTVGIVGLGVMGASFAARTKELGYRVLGMDIDQKTVDYALEHDMIDEGSIDASLLLGQCDFIILALYPTKLMGWIGQYQKDLRPGTLIMEISGVKSNINEPIRAILRSDLELLSIHPMCGRESRGIEFASGKIFDGANFIIIPNEAIYQFICGNCDTLFSYALQKHVMITSPTTLVGILFTLQASTNDFYRASHLEEIEKELFKLKEDIGRLEERTEKSLKSLDALGKQFQNVYISARKISTRFDSMIEGKDGYNDLND